MQDFNEQLLTGDHIFPVDFNRWFANLPDSLFSSPCACGGREPIAVVDGGITDLGLEHIKRGPDHPFDEFTIACRGRGLHRPVDVLIFDAAEGAKE